MVKPFLFRVARSEANCLASREGEKGWRIFCKKKSTPGRVATEPLAPTTNTQKNGSSKLMNRFAIKLPFRSFGL